MSYEKQTWKTGDIITSEGLNHIEEGIDHNSFYFVNIIEENNVRRLDKTFAEIEEAALTKIIMFKQQYDEYHTSYDFLGSIGIEGNADTFVLRTLTDTSGSFYCGQDKNNYPVYQGMK